MTGIFLYGTLLHVPLFHCVAGPCDGTARMQPSTLARHRVVCAAGAALPTLAEDAHSDVTGLLWTGLSAAQRDRIDSYELPFGYVRRLVEVVTQDGGVVPAAVYVHPDGVQGGGADWSLGRWLAQDGEVALNVAREIAAHEPPLAGEELARQWKMITGRAHAVQRAGGQAAPATVRHAAAPEDHDIRPLRPLAGGFFKLAAMEMSHRRFDGTRAQGLPREVLVGADAALVLPYDPVRDRVLLVEQFRAGPARRGDRNPWCLEPVAGMIDAGETPEQAALRETVEEAGLTLDRLEPIFSFYASPGSSTDHFYCFLGLVDLPDDHARFGGLADEAEDLALHVLPLHRAMGLVETGEVNAGPLIAMLLWLMRERHRFIG
ncbi:MAG: NUDIX domain-containing protein [Rhodobacterales bacterium]|nr:NUDIX domain-containing protein [Rhodobacterales bacterium]